MSCGHLGRGGRVDVPLDKFERVDSNVETCESSDDDEHM